MRKFLISAVLLGSVLLTACAPETTLSDTEPEEWAPTEESVTETTNLEIDEGATPLESFTYELKDGYAVITDFIGKETEVVITSHIGDLPVTHIGQYSFEAAWDVTSIELPDTVTFIGEQAFLDCESLTAIDIPEGVTVLNRATFAGCLSLTQVTIPAAVTQTDEELFIACPLTDLYVENPALPYASWGLEELETPCTIHAPEGAQILTWAQEHSFPTEVIGGAQPPETEEPSEE